jgi:hypothetical protein
VFAGAPLALVAASGEPTLGGWSSWAEVGEAAQVVLQDAPVVCGEVLMRLPQAILLLEVRGGEPRGGEAADATPPTSAAAPGGSERAVVAVLVELSKAGAGVALVQARVTASKVVFGGGAARPAAGQVRPS